LDLVKNKKENEGNLSCVGRLK